jgi:hypothetical protein
VSVSILELQISNPDTKERIAEVIHRETIGLPDGYAVSILDAQRDDVFDLWVKEPDGGTFSMQLHDDLGELTPAVFRIRLRELLRLLWR